MFEDSILDLLKVLIDARIKLSNIEDSVRTANKDRALPWLCNAKFIDDRIDGFLSSIANAISEFDTLVSEFPTEYTEALKSSYAELLELIKKEYKHEH